MTSIMQTPVQALTLTKVPYTHPVFRRVHRWANMVQVHRAVMALFPETLPGASGERRANANILYRVEPEPAPHVLVQASVPLLDGTLPSTSMQPVLDLAAAGVSVRFRCRLNTVNRLSGSGRRVPVGGDNLADKLLNSRGTGLFEGVFSDYTLTDVHHSVLQGKNGSKINTHRVTGIATIDDVVEFRRKVVHGVGPARAYGCGLLSAIPTG